MNRQILICCIFAVLLISCGRKITSFDFGSTERSTLEIRNIDFEYLTSKSKISYKDDSKDQNATANIRIKKDSIIWFSVSVALGIEAIRGIITQDSMVIVDRINRNYSSWNFDKLSEEFNLTIDYHTIQSILLGNLQEEDFVDAQVSRRNNYFVVKHQKGAINYDNFVSSKSMKLERLLMSESISKNNLVVTYGNFQMVNENILPHKTEINLNYINNGEKLSTTIILDHNKVEFSDREVNFPFNIPEKYDRK